MGRRRFWGQSSDPSNDIARFRGLGFIGLAIGFRGARSLSFYLSLSLSLSLPLSPAHTGL